jgi:hypothetical protein
MKTQTTFNIEPPLLNKSYTISCSIVIEKAIIIDAYIEEDTLLVFKEEFYSKYLLEYGDLRIDFINKEYNKYLDKIKIFLDKETIKEKKRIDKLLSKLNKETIEFLKEADQLNPKRKR